jgi:hypothetical protein
MDGRERNREIGTGGKEIGKEGGSERNRERGMGGK